MRRCCEAISPKTPRTRASQELQRNLNSTKQHLFIGANMVVSRIVAFIVAYGSLRSLIDNETSLGESTTSVGPP
jgi:hypothetical protein